MFKLIIILRNILALSFVIIGVLITTITCYIYSFFCTRNQMIVLISYFFLIIRKTTYPIVGITQEIRGLDNIPTGACIFASKHQSALETSFFFNAFKKYTVYAFKKEINDVPTWGRISKKFGGVAIDRQKGAEILNDFIKSAKEQLEQGYTIVVFPEGTRVEVGKEIKFKKGISKLYNEAKNFPVIPVALNTGLVLPKKSFLIYPGKIIIEFLPAMPSKMPEEDFLQSLQEIINKKTNELITEVSK